MEVGYILLQQLFEQFDRTRVVREEERFNDPIRACYKALWLQKHPRQDNLHVVLPAFIFRSLDLILSLTPKLSATNILLSVFLLLVKVTVLTAISCNPQ